MGPVSSGNRTEWSLIFLLHDPVKSDDARSSDLFQVSRVRLLTELDDTKSCQLNIKITIPRKGE